MEGSMQAVIVALRLFHATTSQIPKHPTAISKGRARIQYLFSAKDRRQLQDFGLSKHENILLYNNQQQNNRSFSAYCWIALCDTYCKASEED